MKYNEFSIIDNRQILEGGNVLNLIVGRNGLIAEELSRRSTYSFTSSSRDTDGFFLDLSDSEYFDYRSIEQGANIILLAAVSSPDECKNDFDKAYNVNVTGTRYFIRKAIEKGAKVLFFSSDVVYGNVTESVDEDFPTHPFGEYARMKDEIEKAFESEKNFKVFRLSYVLSKEDKYLKYLRSCMAENKIAEVFHPFRRKIIFIGDVLDAIEAILDRWYEFPNQKFNICGSENISRKDIADYYNEAVNNRLKYTLVEPNEAFWKARPKEINIVSLYLEDLLGRKPTKISEAVKNMAKGDR